MPELKQFKSYEEQVQLLQCRGMYIADTARAQQVLSRLNYYRLSGYWYPMRCFDTETGEARDEFQENASFEMVVALYEFDEQLRHDVFIELDRVEMAIRAQLGYELGRIEPLVHLNPGDLGQVAHRRQKDGNTVYATWLNKYEAACSSSKEDFVRHHKQKYGGEMPVWVAVEIMPWGMLSQLYRMSPIIVRNRIAKRCGLRAPQLESWLKSLNIVRNYAAHHARMFNRVYDIKPKLSSDKRLEAVQNSMNRVFGLLTLIQYLHHELKLSQAQRLPRLLEKYPHNELVPFKRLGAPDNWRELELWA